MDDRVIKTNIKNLYKGLFSYEEEDKDLFYGRKTEQRTLSRLVRHNFLTVIFGKSGIGKTSLLHAGLFPQIREKGFLPISLRLDYSSPSADLNGQVRVRISKELETQDIQTKKMDGDEEAAALGAEETLWEYFHKVRHFNASGSREIISMPGGIMDEHVINDILHMFYPEDSQEELPDENVEIEPSILSLLCFQLWEKEKDGTVFISKTDKNRILADFYQSVLEVFPREVETFIESKLLTEGGFRTPFFLEPGYPMKETLDTLVDRRILRKVFYGEKEHIEIIHDVLAPVIKEKRNIRLEEERKQAFRKELRRKRLINRVIIIAGVISILLAFYAFVQKNKADKQFKKAMVNSLIAETYLELPRDNVKAIRIAEAAYQMASPHPLPRLIQVLSVAAASTLEHPFYNISMQHSGMVYRAMFSPDGKRLLTASSDKTAKLWDLKGNLLAEFKKHTGTVCSAVFSPDSKRILTASDDGTAKLWYTPEAIIQWLKTANIPQLSKEDKERLGIE